MVRRHCRMSCGFAVAVLTILAGEAHILGLDGALAGSSACRRARWAPTRQHRDAGTKPQRAGARARDPHFGGEVIYDREMPCCG